MATTKETTMLVHLKITDAPSRSKGWARASLTGPSGPVITSNTGNPWVSTWLKLYGGEATEGDALTLTLQCELSHGSRGQRKLYTETYALVATDGASEAVSHRPASQGIAVIVTGARLVPAEAPAAIAVDLEGLDLWAQILERAGMRVEIEEDEDEGTRWLDVDGTTIRHDTYTTAAGPTAAAVIDRSTRGRDRDRVADPLKAAGVYVV